MALYAIFNGVKYDAKLISYAKRYSKGGKKFTVDHAKKFFNCLKDGNSYTDIEKKTVRYIRKNFKWSNAADDWFRSAIRSWAATRGAKKAKRNSKSKTTRKTVSKKNWATKARKKLNKKNSKSKTTRRRKAA